jgi:predicted nucleotide-binding protein (sugar kinase/HSP70/actin superfamily)
VQFEGEAIMTVGRSVTFAKQGASLIVNCSPFGCMVGSLSGGVLQRVQAETGVPVVNLFYDGDGELNKVLDIYIASARERLQAQGQSATRTTTAMR